MYLPPRINLRFVGSHLFIYACIFMFITGLVLGVTGVVGWFCWLLFLLTVYVIVKVVSEPADYYDELLRRFGQYLVADDVSIMSGRIRSMDQYSPGNGYSYEQ